VACMLIAVVDAAPKPITVEPKDQPILEAFLGHAHNEAEAMTETMQAEMGRIGDAIASQDKPKVFYETGTDDSGKVTAVSYVDKLTGTEQQVRCRTVVLSAAACESARAIDVDVGLRFRRRDPIDLATFFGLVLRRWEAGRSVRCRSRWRSRCRLFLDRRAGARGEQRSAEQQREYRAGGAAALSCHWLLHPVSDRCARPP